MATLAEFQTFLNKIQEYYSVDPSTQKICDLTKEQIVHIKEVLSGMGITIEGKSKEEIFDQIKMLMEMGSDNLPQDQYLQVQQLFELFTNGLEQGKQDVIEMSSKLTGNQQVSSLKDHNMNPELIKHMNPELIKQALDRNATGVGRNATGGGVFTDNREMEMICKKMDYSQEISDNGIIIHVINGKRFAFSAPNEFVLADMKDSDGRYTMDAITKTEKYIKFQQRTGMNKLTTEQVFAILGEFGEYISINEPIDLSFFSLSPRKALTLQRYREILKLSIMIANITGSEGEVVLSVRDGDINIVNTLGFFSNGMGGTNHTNSPNTPIIFFLGCPNSDIIKNTF